MQHPDEGTIHAWLDGALSAGEGRAIEEHATTCAECAAAIAEARGLIAGSSRILAALDAVPGGVLPSAESLDALGSERVKPAARPAWWRSVPLRAAAAIVLVGSVSWLATRSHVQRDATLAAPVASASAEDRMLADTTTETEGAPEPAIGNSKPATGSPKLEHAPQAATVQPKGFEVPRPAPVPPSVAARREAANVVTQQAAPVADVAADRVAEPSPAASPVAPPVAALGGIGEGTTAERVAAGRAADEQRLAASPLAMKRASVAMSAPMAAPLMPGRAALRELGGCYVLWLLPQPAADSGVRAAAALMPTAIELREERAATGDPAAMAARPAEGEPALPATAQASWKTLGERLVEVKVADGARSVVATLTLDGESVGGSARVSATGKDSVVYTVRGRRAKCSVPKHDR
jgi:hypothetical protein